MQGHWSDLLFNLSMSLIGGLVKALLTKSKKRKQLSKYISSAIVGGFAGLLTYMICNHFGLSWQMTSFATGVAGYMGESILDLFSTFLPKLLKGKFKIEIQAEDEKSKEDDE